jgi:hypothetical protein
MSITVKAGSAAAALAGSRWFVPLVRTAAGADAVQMVALTDITVVELTKIQNGAGTPEDKQRAMAVLLTQLVVVGGLTALSVQGARPARALSGQPLEIVEQNGARVLRVVGEDASPPVGESKVLAGDAHEPSVTSARSRQTTAGMAPHRRIARGRRSERIPTPPGHPPVRAIPSTGSRTSSTV